MTPGLRVCLLGGFRLHLSEQAEAILRPRAQSLLAYLLFHRRAPVSRGQIAALFWPEASEDQARTNLRNILHSLRQAIPDCERYLAADQNRLEWRADAPVSVDIEEFEACLKAEPGKAIRPDDLERAARLYAGDLLPDCYDDWIQPSREQLRQAFHSVLSALATLREDERDYSAALAATRRLLQADPLHPEANRRIMRLHCLTGDPGAALKAYRTYVRLLQSELDEEPDPETQALYAQIRDSSPGTPAGRETSRPDGFVGRKAEWRRLQSYWGMTQKSGSQLVMIRGEAGIGKTRLVEELGEWARLQSIEVAKAACYPAEGSLPYAALVSWLRARPLPALEKSLAGEIARLLPEYQPRQARAQREAPAGESWQRQRLFDALARAILAKRQGLILVLEDIHWCDQDTLEWLHYLLRCDPRARVLVVATLRSGEILAEHPVTQLQAALQAEGKYNELELRPLSEAETFQLASQTLRQAARQELSPEEAAQVYRQAEGNPLFVIEMVRLGLNELSGPDPLASSERAQAVLSRRIGKLSPAARDLTSLAALIGREFSLDVLRCASGESEERIVAALDEMLQRQIIREISADSYDFSHDRLREAALSGMSSAHRRLLHRKIAEAYRTLDENAPRPRYAETASHYQGAGLAAQAIHFYREAAGAAAEIFANADALRHIRRAVELAEIATLNEPARLPDSGMAQMLELMGDLQALAGSYPQAQRSYELALDRTDPAERIWRSRVYRKISDGLVPQYRHAGAHAALDRAEEALRSPGEQTSPAEQQEWLQIQLTRIQVFYWQNDIGGMEALIQRVLPLIEPCANIHQQIFFLSLQSQARMRRERFRISDETLELGRRRIELAEKHANPFDLAVAQFQYGFALLWHGDLPASLDWLKRGYEATRRIGSTIWQVRSLAYLGVARRKLGETAGMREEILALLDMAGEIRESTYIGIGQANLGWLAWREGERQEAVRLCRQANETWGQIAAGAGNVFHWLADWVLLAIAVERGDLAAAAERAEALLDPSSYSQALEPAAKERLEEALAACRGASPDAALERFCLALEAARACREL